MVVKAYLQIVTTNQVSIIIEYTGEILDEKQKQQRYPK